MYGYMSSAIGWLRARGVDVRERLHGAAPVPRPGAFVMRDDHRHTAPPTGGERLVERVDDLVGLVADMRRVYAAGVAGDAGEQRELIDVGGGAGRVEHAGAQAGRARGHALAQQLDHPRLLGRRGATVRIVHRRHPQRRVADQRRDVDRGPRRFDRRDIRGHRRMDVLVAPPSRLSGGGASACTSGARLMPQLPMTTVVTPWLIFGSICGAASTIWSSCVCTSMKPGATILPATSMHLGVPRRQARADGGDAVAFDAHVGDETRRAACRR